MKREEGGGGLKEKRRRRVKEGKGMDEVTGDGEVWEEIKCATS